MRNVTLLLMVVLSTLLASGTVFAYTIVLKDGSTIAAQEPYEARGEEAVVTLLNGSQTYIPLSEIDAEATVAANSDHNLGTAVVVTEKGVERFRRETRAPRDERDLSDLLRERRRAREEEDEEETEGTETVVRVRRTAGGYADLMSLRRQPYASAEIRGELAMLLAGSDLSRYKIYRGTRPERIMIELVASNELEVFAALELLTTSLLELQQKYTEVGAFEVLMTSASRQRSGQFVLTAENATLLAGQQLRPAEFFVEFVQY